MSKHLHNISAVLSAGKFVHLSNFYIDYLPHWNTFLPKQLLGLIQLRQMVDWFDLRFD